MEKKEIGIQAWLVRKTPDNGENDDQLFLDEMDADMEADEQDSVGVRKGRFLTDEEYRELLEFKAMYEGLCK